MSDKILIDEIFSDVKIIQGTDFPYPSSEANLMSLYCYFHL